MFTDHLSGYLSPMQYRSTLRSREWEEREKKKSREERVLCVYRCTLAVKGRHSRPHRRTGLTLPKHGDEIVYGLYVGKLLGWYQLYS